MNESPEDEAKPARDWDRYWRGTWEAAAHADGGPQDRALERFWRDFFEDLPEALRTGRFLDIAAGNGAALRYLRGLASPPPDIFALDYSVSALFNLRRRHPGVHCLAADAFHPPLIEGGFAAVVSQFGIEYAGVDAIDAAATLVAAGGCLALVLHYRDGAIYRECANNRKVLLDIERLDILRLARDAFGAGFALNAGRGSAERFKAAERAFTPAVRGLEQLLKREGRRVAGGLPAQLYRDLAAMYRRMSAYEEADVMDWIDGLGPELDAYIGRMKSMLDAAVDAAVMDDLRRRLTAAGFGSVDCDALVIGSGGRPAAWTLVAWRV